MKLTDTGPDAWFDFLANVPESQHAGLMLFSDHATPDGNHFSAYGCHTFKWVNAQGESVFIKVNLPHRFSADPAVPFPPGAWAEAA